METSEIDQFVTKVSRSGGSLIVIIPNRNVEFAGLEEGDIVKVYFKKMVKDEKIGDANDSNKKETD